MYGRILLDGDDVKQDLQNAVVLRNYAAASGHTKAAFWCCRLLAEVLGVRKDWLKAAYYLKAAAYTGNVEAVNIIGSSIPDAVVYLKTAAEKGHIHAMISYAVKLHYKMDK